MKRLLNLLLCLLLAIPVQAATTTYVKHYPTDTAVQVAPLSGATVTNDCVKFDANGNITDAGAACGSGGGSGSVGIGTVNLAAVYVGVSTVGPASNVYFVGNNVGIGTAVPQSRLDVTGSDSGTTLTSASDAMAAITNTNTTANNFSDLAFCEGTSTGAQTCSSKIAGVHTSHTNGSASGAIAFLTQNAGTAGERMRITAAGNVGIGSISPGQVLDVQGNQRTSGTGQFARVGIGVAPDSAIGLYDTVSASETTAGDIENSHVNGYGLFVGSVGTSGRYIFRAAAGATAVLTVLSTGLTVTGNELFSPDNTFDIGATGATRPRDLFLARNALVSGNVGIGSLSPGQALDAQGSVRASTSLISPILAGGSSTTQTLTLQPTTGAGTTGSDLILSAGNNGATQGIRILASGNIGIGTYPAPTDVVDGIAKFAIVKSNAGTFSINSVTTSGNISPFEVLGNTTGAAEIDFNNGNNTIWRHYFHGASTSGTTAGITNAKLAAIICGGAASGPNNCMFGATNDVPLVFVTNNTNVMYAKAGNVGIGGLTVLKNVLDVNGSMAVGGYSGSYTAPSSGAIIQGNVGIGTQGPRNLLEVGLGILNVTSANVGIGSTTPGQALDVNGTIRIPTLGKTLAIASGTNGCQGQATLTSGTVTVSTTCTPASSQGIFLQDSTTGSLVNVGTPTVGTVTGGTSFVINSSNALDASNVNWWILKAS